MAKPVVVIVGRTNVGKSTLFNRMTESHTAIVEDTPGVTRDRNYLDAEWEGKSFFVVDTGGFYAGPADDIVKQVTEQALFAVEEGDVIVQMLAAGESPSTENATLLRTGTVLWAVNKIDGPT
jgi:GTP-binding protein